jgi:hypothetical protein
MNSWGVVKNVDDEHFIVWMRPAALPSFRKLYGRIRADVKKGEVLAFDVSSRYPVSGFSGTKAIVVTTLSFLGVGIQEPTPDWGLMIAQEYRLVIGGYWWVTVFPALAIASLVIAVNLIADRLQEVMEL